MKLSIIIPVYNEENHIEQVILEILKTPIKLAKEIIIVDDCSTDKTKTILRKYQSDKSIKVIFSDQNRGKGAAIRKGIELMTGDILLIQDADLEYSVNDYPALLKPLLAKKTLVVYGSRFKGKILGMRWQNYLANKILTFITNLLYKANISDEATAYKVFTREIIQSLPLKSARFDFCPEVTAKILKRGYKIIEVPISYQARNAKQGKKIKFQDGLIAFWTLIKYRFVD